MAELILSPIVSVVMEMLGSATVEKLVSLWAVKDDLEDLKESVSSIQAVLLDAEEKQSHNKQVSLWLHRLEDVVTDVDDLFDEVATEGLRRQLMPATTRMKKVRTFFSRSNQISFRYKMAKEIRNIKKKMAKIAADRNNFQFVESRDENVRPMRSGRESRSFVLEENVVGRVGDEREVLELMLSPKSRVDQERVSVIPIVGMGGLGKTTLAQLIYNNEKVKDHFEPRIWVCVSDDFDERTIVGKIVESITRKCTKDDTLENLQNMLQERTDGKRYFLVLDDVWSEEWHKWQNVKELLLNCGTCGSMIVVTTRSHKVASLASKNQSYHLGILGEDDSWSLFKKMAFKQGREPVEASVVETGKEIVKKCGGIPLAIRMIAGMLSELDPKTKWSSFLNKELSSIPQKYGDILPTLRLSYNCLPPNLKHCFAYCSLFPKDYIFDVETLVNLWIAQGFINEPSDGSQCLEDVGYDYFLELVWRSFFQELQIDILDKVVRCKMHDLVHDLAIQVGGEKYVRLKHVSVPNALEKARHVSLDWRESIPSSSLQAKKLRSFIRPGTDRYIESEFCGETALEFSSLRMLDLHKSQNNEVPLSIVKLKHLRYLDLSENVNITSLPASITKLVNLQTLNLTGCRNLRLPTGIGKLVNLRHLTWSNEKQVLPGGVSQLTNLRTLSSITLNEDPTSIKLNELLGLNNLRGYLEINNIRSGIDVSGAILKEKKHLQSLRLCWSNPNSDAANPQEAEKTLEGLQPNQTLRALSVDSYVGIRFSNWLPALTNLVELRLVYCVNLKQLPSLESLCALRKMYVMSCEEMEYIEMDVNGEPPIPVFSSLQHLELSLLPSFKGWNCSNMMIDNEDEGVQLLSYFPCLTSLKVIGCPKLISMPLYPNVKKLNLYNTNPNLFEQTVSVYNAHPQISQTTDSSSPLPSSTSRFDPLVEVTKLRLCCHNRTDVQYLPDWMQNFSCLETLEINGLESNSFSLDRGVMTWVIDEGDERQRSVGGNQTNWEIFSGIRNLMLVEVPMLSAQYFPSFETLKSLHISSCDDLAAIPNWSCKLSSLQQQISSCHNLAGIPNWSCQLSSLQQLQISSCHNLSAIPNWIWKLSSLQQLQISSCKKLESMLESLSSLTSLQTLKIRECPILTLDDEIKWEALVSLHFLSFSDLPKLVTLPDGIQHATTLQTLCLSKCDNLIAIPDWINNLSSLQEIEIYRCPKIESLPRSIKSLTSLQTLTLSNCDNLIALPDCINNLSSLQLLEISECPKIESLPGTIQSLTSLQTLKIFECPSLSKRCQRHVGEDWPIICHIPNLDIRGRWTSLSQILRHFRKL